MNKQLTDEQMQEFEDKFRYSEEQNLLIVIQLSDELPNLQQQNGNRKRRIGNSFSNPKFDQGHEARRASQSCTFEAFFSNEPYFISAFLTRKILLVALKTNICKLCMLIQALEGTNLTYLFHIMLAQVLLIVDWLRHRSMSLAKQVTIGKQGAIKLPISI